MYHRDSRYAGTRTCWYYCFINSLLLVYRILNSNSRWDTVIMQWVTQSGSVISCAGPRTVYSNAAAPPCCRLAKAERLLLKHSLRHSRNTSGYPSNVGLVSDQCA